MGIEHVIALVVLLHRHYSLDVKKAPQPCIGTKGEQFGASGHPFRKISKKLISNDLLFSCDITR